MEEWKEYKYTDLCTLIGGGTPKTSEPSYWGGDIPWLSVKDFGNDEKYVYSTEKTITEAGLNNSSTKLLRRDDIIISARGTIGAIAMLASEMAFNQSCFGIRSNDIVEQHYLYYLTKTKISELQKNSHGSVFDTITRDTFAKIDCVIPSKKIQRQIASILSSLDDKIEVNRKINENLEQQAQALFKSWFVDFKPFKNGEFVESELGMIPKGWRVGKLFDVAEIFDKIRKPLSGRDRENMDRIYPYYGATSCMDYVDNYLFDGIYTLIGEDGSVAKEDGLPYMQYVWGKFWVNNHAHILQGKNGFSTEMIHVFLSMTNIQHLVTGAVQAKLSQANMQKITLPIPPKEVVDEIRQSIDIIYEYKRNLEDESRRLAEIRDTLLPKLMSGELKVLHTDLVNEMLEKGIR